MYLEYFKFYYQPFLDSKISVQKSNQNYKKILIPTHLVFYYFIMLQKKYNYKF
jgi:hypothetical protein